MNTINKASEAIRESYTAVLVAGGRSTRMGHDKAGLIIDGVPLWRRQLAILRALDAADLLISGRRDGPYKAAGVEIVEDITPEAGPMGALEAVLVAARTPFVIVLGVDMPGMHPAFLQTLMSMGTSVVPTRRGAYEPMAAVYGKALAPMLAAAMRSGDHSMQPFIRAVVEAGLAVAHPVGPAEFPLFKNVNWPGDLDTTDTAQAL